MKTLKIPHPTNLGAPWLVTIGPAPKELVPETQLPADFLLQVPNDNGRYQLITFARIHLHALFDAITWAAAGMDAVSFCRHYYEQYPASMVNPQVAIYSWKKI